jgi:hypothetical protein
MRLRVALSSADHVVGCALEPQKCRRVEDSRDQVPQSVKRDDSLMGRSRVRSMFHIRDAGSCAIIAEAARGVRLFHAGARVGIVFPARRSINSHRPRRPRR